MEKVFTLEDEEYNTVITYLNNFNLHILNL